MSDSPLQNDIPKAEFQGICHTCVRRRGVLTCSAFPNGIPVKILKGDFNHTQPFPGDNGLQYVKRLR